MRLFAAALLLSLPCCAAAQVCGPKANFDFRAVKERAAIEKQPPSDMGLVYIIQISPWVSAGGIHQPVASDREWVGVSGRDTYIVLAMSPGTHEFCSPGSNGSPIYYRLNVEAGRAYHVALDVIGNSFSDLPSDDASVLLKKCKRATFWPKSQPGIEKERR